jgi:hypothetical protein
MTYDDETVLRDAEALGLPLEPENTLRVRLAMYFEHRGDKLAGWEVRTGRPWNEMTRLEAEALTLKHPEFIMNPGVRSRLEHG